MCHYLTALPILKMHFPYKLIKYIVSGGFDNAYPAIESALHFITTCKCPYFIGPHRQFPYLNE